MSAWAKFLSDIQEHVADLENTQGCDAPFFRGHSDADWKLLCGLGRQKPEEFKKKNIESILYYDFTSLAGPLLEGGNSSWDVLFAMQHHGLPTRLLDWTTTFSVALYFALKPYIYLKEFKEDFPKGPPGMKAPCIWILNPFNLNESSMGYASVLNPITDLDVNYWDAFIVEEKKFPADVVALNPVQTGRRLSVQRGAFTFHADLFSSIEEKHKRALKKFILPTSAIYDALSFLSLTGMNEYSLFPDLDGLARYLKRRHVDWL